MTLERYLVNHGHIHRLVVRHGLTGWDVREEEDATVIRRTHHEDWHRVERAVKLFEQAQPVASLEKEGWVEGRPLL